MCVGNWGVSVFLANIDGRAHHSKQFTTKAVRHLAIVGLAAYYVPLAAPFVLFGRLTRELPSTWNTQVASVAAAILAALLFRRVSSYPGARAFSYVVPAYSITFGIAAAGLLLLRVPYSGPMLLTGYIATMALSFLLPIFEKTQTGVFYYVPSGAIDSLAKEIPFVKWVRLEHPILPSDTSASIVADLRSDHSAEWERMLAQAAIAGRTVYHMKQLGESMTGRVQIEHLSENSFGSLIPALAYRGIKRTIDVISAVILLPILAIPMMLIASLVKLSSPGPALFRQSRMGYRGIPFLMLKFRTMTQVTVSDDICERAAAITKDSDSRITSVGRFLRKSRMDELPQIFNILKGEMSWIGPRPEAIPLSKWYEEEIPFYSYRHIVRPGITGWAQVNQGHVAEIADVNRKLQFDFYYIKFFSFWLDILIALKTIRIIITGVGAK